MSQAPNLYSISAAAALVSAYGNAKPYEGSLEQLFIEQMIPEHEASPAQLAICRIIEGRPLGALARHPDVIALLGGEEAIAKLPRVKPKEILLLAAIRCGKSQIAAAACIHASQNVDISKLSAGETPRVSLISLTKDLGAVAYKHLTGSIQASPKLSALLVDEPTADSVLLRHPSGREIEIKVAAGARAGASLVSRWCAGVVFDEAPRMIGAEDGVVNFSHSSTAVRGRLLPGAQLLAIGSPWAPFGPIYEMTKANFKEPSKKLVVMRAVGPVMNPSWWTPERCEELRELDAVAYKTDVLGEFADPESGMFSSDLLSSATREGPLELPPETCKSWYAAIDPATRSNAFTLVVVGRDGPRLRVGLTSQQIPKGGVALRPGAVLADFAELLKPYGVTRVRSDQWSADALADLAVLRGIIVDDEAVTGADRTDLYTNAKTLMSQGLVELSPDPEMRTDMLLVKKKTTQTGIVIELPQTSDGRHCDYAPSLVLAIDDAFRHGAAYSGTEDEVGKKREMKRDVRARDKRTSTVRRGGF